MKIGKEININNDNSEYYVSKHNHYLWLKNTIQNESRYELEEDVFKFMVENEKIYDLICDKKRLWKKDLKKLRKILNFE